MLGTVNRSFLARTLGLYSATVTYSAWLPPWLHHPSVFTTHQHGILQGFCLSLTIFLPSYHGYCSHMRDSNACTRWKSSGKILNGWRPTQSFLKVWSGSPVNRAKILPCPHESSTISPQSNKNSTSLVISGDLEWILSHPSEIFVLFCFVLT